MKKVDKLIKLLLVLIVSLIIIGGCAAKESGNSGNVGNENANKENVNQVEADPYPTKNINLVVPYSAGGSVTVEVQALAQYAGKLLGQTFVIENKTGAGGTIGTDYVWNAEPDGYTYVAQVFPHLVFGEFLNKTEYNVEELKPILGWASDPKVIIVPPNSPYENFTDLYEASQKKTLSAATTGNGTSGHLQLEVLDKDTGLKTKMVPYDGGGDVNVAVMGGHVDLGVNGLDSTIEQAKNGQLKIIAIHANERNPKIPDVPTLKELGYKDRPNALLMVRGMFAAPGVSDDKIEVIRKAFKDVLNDSEFQQWAEQAGREFYYISPEELKAIAKETKSTIEELYK